MSGRIRKIESIYNRPGASSALSNHRRMQSLKAGSSMRDNLTKFRPMQHNFVDDGSEIMNSLHSGQA